MQKLQSSVILATLDVDLHNLGSPLCFGYPSQYQAHGHSGLLASLHLRGIKPVKLELVVKADDADLFQECR